MPKLTSKPIPSLTGPGVGSPEIDPNLLGKDEALLAAWVLRGGQAGHCWNRLSSSRSRGAGFVVAEVSTRERAGINSSEAALVGHPVISLG